MNQLDIIDEQRIEDVAHGDDLHRYKGLIKANFSSNVWPFGIHPLLKKQLAGALDGIGAYPSPRAETVLGVLAQKHAVEPDTLLAVNGTAEAIYLLAQAFAGATSYIVGPTFGEYAQACRIHNHKLTHVHEDGFGKSIHLPNGLWWICNPNNPTGKVYEPDMLMELVRSNPHSFFVVDEAYAAFSLHNTSVDAWAGRVDNLVVLKSLTKSFAVPGIRTGYVVGCEAIINKMRRLQPPWSVGALALSVLMFSADNEPFSHQQLSSYLQTSAHLQLSIGAIPGFDVHPSPMGFFLVRTPFQAADLKAKLVNNHGLLVRDASNFHGLGNGYIRIAAQSIDDNDLLMGALCTLVDEKNVSCQQ
jgi:threonine-phosphate decarboxylase